MLLSKSKYKDWYLESYEAIKSVYKEDTELFISLLASTSPRKSVKANFRLAHNIYLNIKQGFNPFFMVQGYLKAHVNNVYRSIRKLSLSGSKVEAFRRALLGDENAVVIDTWILKYFKVEKQSLTPLQYKRMALKIKDNARKHDLTPAQYQASIWELVRARHGFKPVSFKSVMEW